MQKLKAFVSKSSAKEETTFTVFAPPGLGYYKLVVFAARTPRNKEKLYMPVVATFLVRVLNNQLEFIINISIVLSRWRCESFLKGQNPGQY